MTNRPGELPAKEVLSISLMLGWLAHTAVAQTTTFSATGAIPTYVVPPGASQVTIDASGAQGGTANPAGGLGARLVATFPVTPGEVLNIVVGGVGSAVSGGEQPPTRRRQYPEL